MDEALRPLLCRWLFCAPAEIAARDADLALQPRDVRLRFHREREILEQYLTQLLPGHCCTPEEWLELHPDLSLGARALTKQIHRVLAENRRAKRIGQQIGSYTVLYRMGEGGMGEVYAVERFVQEQPSVRALKLVRLADRYQDAGEAECQRILKDLHARLWREAASLEEIRHPHVVRYWDKDDDRTTGELYLVTELVEGASLECLLETGGPLPLTEALAVVIEVCEGLTAAHAAGVWHRDISAGNVLVDQDGCTKIIDFGLSRFERGTGLAAGTAPDGIHWRTLRYASPEQLQGQATAASDQYSLGKLFYVLLGYDPEWELHPEWQLPLPADPFWRRLPAGYAEVIQKATAREPQDRYSDMNALLGALRQLAGAATPPKPGVIARVREVLLENYPIITRRVCRRLYTEVIVTPPSSRPPSPPPRRQFVYAAAGAVATLAFVAVLGFTWRNWSPRSTEGAPPAAVNYKGEFDLSIVERGGERLNQEILLGGEEGQRVLSGDRIYLQFQLRSGLTARHYVLHIDSRGVATPLYPLGWKLDGPLPAVDPCTKFRLPEKGTVPLANSPTGLEALIWLVRDAPLTPKDNQALKELLTPPNLKWKQPADIPEHIFPMEDGQQSLHRGAPEMDKPEVAADPVSQTENVCQEIKKYGLARYSRAVCYPFVKR